jgi:hypothetical protein
MAPSHELRNAWTSTIQVSIATWRAGRWATIVENLGSMGIITLQNGERFACNPTKGFPSNFMKGINLLY